jgi:hypothetical protein
MAVAAFDFRQNAVEVTGGIVVLRCRTDHVELLANVPQRLAATCDIEGLPDPLGNRHAARARQALNFPVFRVLENDLQSFSHDMSLYDSSL